jgi:hypothetical protein
VAVGVPPVASGVLVPTVPIANVNTGLETVSQVPACQGRGTQSLANHERLTQAGGESSRPVYVGRVVGYRVNGPSCSGASFGGKLPAQSNVARAGLCHIWV